LSLITSDVKLLLLLFFVVPYGGTGEAVAKHNRTDKKNLMELVQLKVPQNWLKLPEP